MSVKALLEKFIALPISVFRNRMDRVEKRIQSLDAKLTKEKLVLDSLIEQQQQQQQKQQQAQQQQHEQQQRQHEQQQKQHEQQQKQYEQRQKQYEQQQKQHEQQQKQHEEQKKRDEEQRKQLSTVKTELDKVDKKRYYTPGYELGVINSFYELYESPDFKDKFLRLISGLKREEVAKIVCILERQKKIKDKAGERVDLYTPEEQVAIKHMMAYCNSHILTIQEDLFCFDGYLLPRKHFELSVFYFKHGIEDLDDKAREFVKGKSIIDVGGFYGDSVLVLEELSPKNVYTFEAISENYEILKETMELNNIDNCIAEKLALGDEEGEICFDIRGSQSNMQTLNYLETIDGKETVQVTTLDKYMEDKDIEVGLIKVDIEGAEQAFLRGAKDTIVKQKPVLLMSIYHNADDFFNIKPIIESWNLGYKFKIHKPCDYTVSREVLLICEP